MPRLTFKQRFLLELEDAVALYVIIQIGLGEFASLRDVSNDDYVTILLELYLHASSKRYLIRQAGYRRRPLDKFFIDLNPLPVADDSQPWLNDVEFITAYRMTRKAFYAVVRIIRNHASFCPDGRGRRQYPVEHQVMIFLHYLSSPGSSASGGRTRNHFHVGYGSRDLYIRRCVKAIRECMHRRYYRWPDEIERQELAAEFHARFKLPNCILIADGTTFRLNLRPKRDDAADYSGRKDGYTITNLFFSDVKRRIRYYTTGWAGSTHDNRMWTNCKLYRWPSRFFSHNQYIVGDSAFDSGPHMVTTYRAPTGGSLQGSKLRFNKLLSSPRVISEHVNGILKGRFPWLTSIPNELTEDRKSMRRILEIIDVCVVLHNFLIEHNLNHDDKLFFTAMIANEMQDDDSDFESLGSDDELNQPINADAHLATRREQLRAYLSEGGII